MAAQLLEQMQSSGEDVRGLMEGEMPTCKCVKMAADGSCEELLLDMTPKTQAVQDSLGGGVTFVGQWEPLGVFLVARRDDAGLPEFKGALPKPFDLEPTFRGAVLMTRTLEDGTPADFPLAEFEAFRAKAPEPWQEYPEPEPEPEEEAPGLERILEEDSEDEDSDEDAPYDSDAADEDERDACDEDEDDGGELRDMLVKACLDKFAKDEGREPTEEEQKVIVQSVLEKLGATLDDFADSGDEEEESEDDEESEEEEAEEDSEDAAAMRSILLEKCLGTFVENQGREPTAEERAAIEASVASKLEPASGDAAGEALVVDKVVEHFTAAHGRAPEPAEIEDILEKLRAAEAARDGEEAPAEEEGEPDILGQLVELFKQQNGRDPTEAEVQQWRDTLKEAAEEGALEEGALEEGTAEEDAAASTCGALKPAARANEAPPADAPPAKKAKLAEPTLTAA